MKKKIGAGGRARAIGKLDLEIWAVSVMGFALMRTVQHQSQTTNDAFLQIKGPVGLSYGATRYVGPGTALSYRS